MTPQGHFTSLTKKLKNFTRPHRYPIAQGRALDAYALSEAFLDSMVAISPQQRKRVLVMYGEALAACTPRTPPMPPPGTRRLKWDGSTILAFRRAYAQGGLELAQRKFGLSIGAARLAVKRHVLAATEHRVQAS